jgi:hypothetical protein
MNKSLIAAALAASMASFNATAQDFNLQLDHKYGDVWESLSGVIVISDKDCDVEDYQPVVLHYYNTPADSRNGVGTNDYFANLFLGNGVTRYDNFTYEVEEAVIVKPKSCEDDSQYSGGECVSDDSFEPYIDYQMVTKTCDVYGVARLSDTGTKPIEFNSRAVFDASSGRYYITNTEIWQSMINTGVVIDYVEMELDADNRFSIKVIE